jgi:hypothetical protein
MIHDGRYYEIREAQPTMTNVKRVLDRDDFFAMSVVQTFVMRCPAAIRLRVLYAYAEVRGFGEEICDCDCCCFIGYIYC